MKLSEENTDLILMIIICTMERSYILYEIEDIIITRKIISMISHY